MQTERKGHVPFRECHRLLGDILGTLAGGFPEHVDGAVRSADEAVEGLPGPLDALLGHGPHVGRNLERIRGVLGRLGRLLVGNFVAARIDRAQILDRSLGKNAGSSAATRFLGTDIDATFTHGMKITRWTRISQE